MMTLKVAEKSDVNKVAGNIAHLINNGEEAELQAVGAGAVNQAVKSIAVARGFVEPSGVNLSCIPAFTEVEIDGLQRTAIKLILKVD